MSEVPVVWFDGPDLEATAFSVADNKTHEFAAWDDAALVKPHIPQLSRMIWARGVALPFGECRMEDRFVPSAWWSRWRWKKGVDGGSGVPTDRLRSFSKGIGEFLR